MESLTFDKIKKTYGKYPLFFLKFTSCFEYAKDILEGKLYANTPEWFRRREIESGERGQGDKNELQYHMPLIDLKFYNQETKELELEFSQAKGILSYEGDNKTPLVSFVGFTLDEMKTISEDENSSYMVFPFTEKEYKTMSSKFGEYCVIIDAKTLLDGINIYSKEHENAPFMLCKVNYCESNSKAKAEAYAYGSLERFFFKDNDLSYQREYRLVLNIDMPNDHFIRIPPLHDKAIICKSSDLRKKCLGIKLIPDSSK